MVKMIKIDRLKLKHCTLVCFLIVGLFGFKTACYGQMGFGLRLGGNISRASGNAFGANRMGHQLGGDLIFGLNSKMDIQVEPSYNLTRIRVNDNTASLSGGLSKGTRSLKYLNTPVYLKVNFTRKFSILGGLDLNMLLNDDAYKLNDGKPAFNSRTRIGYALGIDLGALYFRYRQFKKNNKIVDNWDAHIDQYQLGFKVRLF